MSDYYDTLQKALDYIEENIKEDISLEQLSELCNYSPHHFHRIFQSIIGIPVADYIRKRKLSKAANDIITTDKNILEIAIDYGFNSNETFSRAFKKIFDITPIAYRKLGNKAIPEDFWKVTFNESSIQKKYMKAVETLTNRLKEDNNIIAIIIMGSLSYDKVWEKSDIDMTIIVNDNSKLKSELCLIEDEIYINGNILTREEFRKLIGKSNRGSIVHSYYSLGTIVYSKDASFTKFFEDFCKNNEIGERDRSYALMYQTDEVLWRLYKAEKWLKVKSNVRYSYIWISEALKHIASIEVLLNNNIPTREVILQALKYNNPVVEKIYLGLMDEKKNSINVSNSIDMIYSYLRDNLEEISKPLLKYFDESNEMKSLSTIYEDFNKTICVNVISEICEWLCEEEVLVKDISETYITSKSKTVVYEPVYFKNDKEIDIFI